MLAVSSAGAVYQGTQFSFMQASLCSCLDLQASSWVLIKSITRGKKQKLPVILRPGFKSFRVSLLPYFIGHSSYRSAQESEGQLRLKRPRSKLYLSVEEWLLCIRREELDGSHLCRLFITISAQFGSSGSLSFYSSETAHHCDNSFLICLMYSLPLYNVLGVISISMTSS